MVMKNDKCVLIEVYFGVVFTFAISLIFNLFITMSKISNRNCCVYGCFSRKGKNPDLSFHKFPMYLVGGEGKDNERNRAWIAALKHSKRVSKYSTVCSLHFKSDDFILPGYSRKKPNLKKTAVPSLANTYGGSGRECKARTRRKRVQSDELDPLEIKNSSEFSKSLKIESIDSHILIDDPTVEDFKNDNKFEVCYLNGEEEQTCERESRVSISETDNASGSVQLTSPKKIKVKYGVNGISNQNCCVHGCRARRYKNPYLSFHTFPMKNRNQVYIENRFGVKERMDRFEAWKMKLNLTKITKSTVVCSLHFKKEDFFLPDAPTKRKRLKLTAVPSLYLQTSPICRNLRNRATKEKLKSGKSMMSRKRADTCNEAKEKHTLKVVDPVELCEISCGNGHGDRDEVHPNHQPKCRICLTTSNLTFLTKYHSLLGLFMDITKIEVQTDDETQRYVCIDCVQKLEDISHFICMAKKNDEELKRTVSVNKRFRPYNKKINSDFSQQISSNVCASDSRSIKSSSLKSNGKEILNSEVIHDMKEDISESSPLAHGEEEQEEVTDRENPGLNLLSTHSENQESIEYACWICGAFIVGVTVPKSLSNVPPSKIKFQCSTCSKSSDISNINSTFLNETKSSSVKETVCRRVYPKKTSRGKETTMRCNTCGEYIPLSEFVKHQLRKHALTGQYKCKECPSRFSHPKSLARHANRHGR